MRITVAAVFAVALAADHAVADRWQPPGTDQQGRLVAVGDHRLYLECGNGTTSPVVMFEAGGGGTSGDWSEVRRLLPPTLSSCAYDRAGAGRSEPGPRPRTLQQEAYELRALLDAGGVRRPYVLVGQSLGGVLVRLFAASAPDEVVGMVLVEPTHESAVLGSARYGGMVRLREKATGRPIPAPRLAPAGAPQADADVDYLAEELARLHAARQRDPQPLRRIPLVVLGGGRRPPAPPGIAAEAWAALRAEREAQVRDLAGLSANSRFVLDAASGHNLHRDNPALVARAVEDVVRAAREGTPLQR
jgi:pimeloyl-ACP methyl ester carboxylesterase